MMRKIIAGLLAAFTWPDGQCAADRARTKIPTRQNDFTLSMKVQLVVETVVVKDKQGNAVHGLTAKDFVVTEDGAPQTITVLRTPGFGG